MAGPVGALLLQGNDVTDENADVALASELALSLVTFWTPEGPLI